MAQPPPDPIDGERPRSKQEIYDRIRESSKDQFIIEEMVRLGFWGQGEGAPAMTEEWVQRRGELTRELRELSLKQKRFEDREAALADMRRQRMADARARREETRQRRAAERQARAEAWREKQASDIVYLGEGVSGGLDGGAGATPDRQQDLGVPEFADLKSLAAAMGISIGELRFLAFNRAVSKTTHYRRFYMPKKAGGKRLISAPMPRLKAAQHWILENVLYKPPVHDAAHGFVPGRSIVSNAAAHVGRDLVVNWDLKDFFPTVTYPRVKGLFRSFGYSEKIATVAALICTEPEVDEVELDGERYFVHVSERRLPQGAPTSPVITNLLCRRFDARMMGTAEKLGFTYTRYADDLSFSASGESKENLQKLLWRVRAIVTDEGFVVHPDKLRIMRKGARQEVTGLTVNERVGVPRNELRRFRALLFQIEKDGPGDKRWNGTGSHMLACIQGYANFVCMVDPQKGEPLRERVRAILAKHGWVHEIRHPRRPPRDYSPKPEAPAGGAPTGFQAGPFVEPSEEEKRRRREGSLWAKIKRFGKRR